MKKGVAPAVADATGDASSRHFNTKGNARGGIIDAVSIHDRPEEVNDRIIPGYWEGDLICGTQKSYIATLVERSFRYTLLVKLTGNDTHAVVSAITQKVIELPQQLKKSLTWDRGIELAQHKLFTIDTDIKVYFCDPKSSWQKGTNEKRINYSVNICLKRPIYPFIHRSNST